jgi:galactose-1-phosphate uridylyltransferase
LGITFKKKVQKSRLLNPTEGFKEIELSLETRWDPLTKRSVRVLNLPIPKFDLWDMEEMLKKGGPQVCPFCPETLEKVTPRFTEDFFPGGRLRLGEVCLFPNRIPFDRYCAVAVMSRQHYVPLSDFNQEMLFNAFSAALIFLRRVAEKDPAVHYSSINWNYLPMAGGSIIHPHLQILAGAFPTYYQNILIQAARRYHSRGGRIYWEDLIDKEKQIGERYIGTVGRTVWLASFAPLGITDLMTVFPGSTSLPALQEQDLKDFCAGLLRVFRFFLVYNHYSFNLGLYSGRYPGQDSFWVQARMMTRRLLPPMGASDVSYFEKIHKESLDYITPERVCAAVKEYF